MNPAFHPLHVFILFCLTVHPSNAQSRYFNVVNNTGKTFNKICVSPCDQERWGNNLIPTSKLRDGQRTRINIPAAYGSKCNFDLKVSMPDGKWYTFSMLDVCELYSITINRDWTYKLVWQ